MLRTDLEVGNLVERRQSGCVRVEYDLVKAWALPLAEFELGVDREALLSRHIITGVKEDSEAFRAGLRDGQQVSGVKLTVVGKTIQYFRRGKTVKSVPQYRNIKGSDCVSNVQ